MQQSRLLLLVVFALTACFTKRDPEPPDGASDFLAPNQPEVVLANLMAAVTKLNVANYERCFERDNFRFFPDATIAQNNVGLFSNWALQPSELDVIRNIDRVKDGTSLNRLVFTNARTNNISADSIEYTADYELQIQHKDTTFTQFSFEGNIILSMRRNTANEYHITRWRDAKTSTLPCWTELKQHFATR